MNLDLTGKYALVTGSSSGIGESIARLLAREGARVAVHARSAARADTVVTAIRAVGGDAVSVAGDFTKPEEVESVAAQVARFGDVDILVNNAGGRTTHKRVTWEEFAPEDWLTCYQLNVVAPAVLIRHALPGMRSRDWGRIIQIGSAVALRPLASNADYAASKAALGTLTLSLTQELVGTKITVNTVSPGATGTPALLSAMAVQARAIGRPDDPESLAQAAAANWPSPLQRLGSPDEIANMVAFLASDRAAFVTGSNVRVDGGRTS